MPAGRPTDYTEELAAKILSRLATGESMRTICLDEDMPARSSIFLWMSKYPAFSDQYAKAKQEAAEALAEEMFGIADDGQNDYMERINDEGEVTGYQVNGEAIQRSRLRVDVRKWYLSKIVPKKYGEKQQIDHSGQINLNKMSDEELDEQIKRLMKDIE